MQDIINKSVEKSAIASEPRDLMKTSSKYYSEVMGLEYEPKSEEEDEEEEEKPLDLSPMKKPEDLSMSNEPAWKKAKTAESAASAAAVHASLPPISALVQSPLALVSYKHSSWVSSSTAADKSPPPTSADSAGGPVNLKNNSALAQLALVRFAPNARTV